MATRNLASDIHFMNIENNNNNNTSSSSTSRFLRRFLQRSQMDWEYTFTQMLLLMVNPKKVYTFSQYRHRMKKQWARDDPAFLIVLTFFILVTCFIHIND